MPLALRVTRTRGGHRRVVRHAHVSLSRFIQRRSRTPTRQCTHADSDSCTAVQHTGRHDAKRAACPPVIPQVIASACSACCLASTAVPPPQLPASRATRSWHMMMRGTSQRQHPRASSRRPCANGRPSPPTSGDGWHQVSPPHLARRRVAAAQGRGSRSTIGRRQPKIRSPAPAATPRRPRRVSYGHVAKNNSMYRLPM